MRQRQRREQRGFDLILLQQGQVEQAAALLEQALAHGSPAFIAHIVPALAASGHARIRTLVADLTP